MRTGLFPKKRILKNKLRSQRGASLVFALVGFMFAAMISFVVINAAYSAASRVKKLKYDEQSFLLAQSMSGIIIDALSGPGTDAKFPDGTSIRTPDGTDLKYDGMAVGYQYIEQKNAVDGSVNRYYNDSENGSAFILNTDTGESKKTFNIVKGKGSLSSAATSVQDMVAAMAKRVDQGLDDEVTETLTTNYTNPDTGEVYSVETTFKMDKNYSINAVTTAIVNTPAGADASRYIVRMDAGADVRTDKLICVGKRGATEGTIEATFSDKIADATGEELVKICCYSVSWPPDKISTVYVAP